MYCCPNCFDDPFLTSLFVYEFERKGNCSFCESPDIELVRCSSLEDSFAALIDSYDVAKKEVQGDTLASLLKKDWVLFGDLQNSKTELLLAAILGKSYSNESRYIKRESAALSVSQWEEFCREIKNKNRFFPQAIQELIDDDSLQVLLAQLNIHSDELIGDDRIYRSRKNPNLDPFPIDEMSAPPIGKASAGRANPYGISYLYVASSINTAISELRPHKNEKLTIAEFEVSAESPLILVDLRNPRKTISPFDKLDEIEQLLSDIELLVRLGNDLTQPVLNEDADLEYLPSQFLCEYIKFLGYDGVIYESALGDGFNIAIFDARQLRAIKSADHIVDAIDISHSPL